MLNNKFKNSDYEILINDIAQDCFYANNSERGKISSYRQLAEVYVRKLLDLDKTTYVTLGNHKITELLQIHLDNKKLKDSLKHLRVIGNDCSHTQCLDIISNNDLIKIKDSFLYLHAYLFINFFQEFGFGNNSQISSVFSLLPPILRLIVLEELYDKNKEDIYIIDKLCLAKLKVFDFETAKQFIEDNKELFMKLPAAMSEKKYQYFVNKNKKDFADQQIKNCPYKNIYELTKRYIEDANEQRKTEQVPVYFTFEEALAIYKQSGIIGGNTLELSKFNDLMHFSYIGRKINK